MDLQAVEDHYRRMPDERLRYFATHEVADLPPEAVVVLRQELKVRNLLPDPDLVIDVQRRRLSPEEFQRMVDRFRALPCPMCGRADEPLNAVQVSRGSDVDLLAGCPACLEEQLSAAANASVGWMLIYPASGLRAGGQDLEALEELRADRSTEKLRQYVWMHRGEYAHLLT